MAEIARRETQWAVMSPDVYGGNTCDKVEPRWLCEADGDHGGADHQTKPLQLSARTFPPGTKVTISEPLCPQCQQLREPIWPTPKKGPIYSGKCGCGFDWDAWVSAEFS